MQYSLKSKFYYFIILLSLVIVTSISMPGCSNDHSENRILAGSAMGAVAGGLIGGAVSKNRGAGAAIGAAVGGITGGVVASETDPRKKNKK